MSGSRPTRFNDTLSGTANNDTVDLLSGNDLYYGLDGDDSESWLGPSEHLG